MIIKMDYSLAMAAARDEANRRMRKAGRKKWTRGDYNLACKTFNKLWSLNVRFP